LAYRSRYRPYDSSPENRRAIASSRIVITGSSKGKAKIQLTILLVLILLYAAEDTVQLESERICKRVGIFAVEIIDSFEPDIEFS